MRRAGWIVLAAVGCAESTEVVSSDAATSDAAPTPITVTPTTTTDVPCASCGGACTETELVYPTAKHVPAGVELIYQNAPPAGGDHDPCWGPWGVSAQPLPTRRWVHNLEHGGVAFLYDCPDGCPDDVAALKGLVEPLGQTALLSGAELPTRFAVIAWGRRMLLDCVDTAAMKAFYDAYQGKAPESLTAMPPSSCMP